MLQEMVDAAKRDVERRRAEAPIGVLEKQLQARDDTRPFREALAGPGLSVIAEFKRRSPSAGDIAVSAVVADQVVAYERSGAAALSILTDAQNFGGSLDDLRDARAASELPTLRKDFIVDPYQLIEAAVFGADAVLLIAAALDSDALASLYREARALDLDCIVEIRTLDELEQALEIDSDIVGINNRDLETLEVEVDKTFDLLTQIPTGKTVVSESGIDDPDQIARLGAAGVDAVLIGHSLMHAPDPEAQMRYLLHGEAVTREHQLP